MAIAQPTSTMQPSLAANRRINSQVASTLPPTTTNHQLNNHDQKTVGLKDHRKLSMVSTKMDRNDRASFSSIKEGDSGIAQTFTTTKTSSYLSRAYSPWADDEEAIQDGFVTPPDGMSGLQTEQKPMLHSFVCPCAHFQGWKKISLGGKTKNKSFGDLRALGHRWAWDLNEATTPSVTNTIEQAIDSGVAKKNGEYPAGQAPFELLPTELLGSIIDRLATDIPPNGFTARNIDLMSLLLTSRGMHSATLATLYKNITIPHSRIFRKFLSHVSEYPALGTIVRRLDFSHFNPTGAGITARERAQTQNLTSATLLQCLRLTTNLREFLAQEHVDDDLDEKVIRTLLCDLPQLKALDLCACSSVTFKNAFNAVLDSTASPIPKTLPITRLSLHECTVLSAATFLTLLPRLPHLTHLDVAHTRMTDSALLSLPTTAKLTHLNLSKCSLLTGAAVVDFLTNHPAAKTLEYLNLGMDAKSHEMLTSEELSDLLPVLPTTLKSLSLRGSKMNSTHLPLLLPLTKHVEELGLGRYLDLTDLTQLFVPEETGDEKADIEEQLAWIPHTMHYVDVSDLSLAQLDLGTLFGMRCPILKSTASPLEVLEISSDVFKKLEKSTAMIKRVGWTLKDAGRRYWLVRIKGSDEPADTGARGWKWGAQYWGMRKVPVAKADVGGMYGLYMFKR